MLWDICLIAFLLVPGAWAQATVAPVCADGGVGMCLGTLCPEGLTCINGVCCRNVLTRPAPTTAAPTTAAPKTAAPVTAPPPATAPPPNTPNLTCADSGIGGCLGGMCPAGAQCINNVCCTKIVTPGTPAAACFDMAADCGVKSYLCTNPAYLSLVTRLCPKTCNLCAAAAGGGGTIRPACFDSASDCQPKAYLCTNPMYLSLMKRLCPATCRLC